jgi:hypothetical protein
MNKSEKAAHARRAAVLGMHFSTASAKLKKSVLFSLVQETGRDICVVCDEAIQTEDDLTFEHIKPWESRDINLFWDLSNIGFSHKKCNKPHRYYNGADQKRIIGPDGTSWCYRCKEFHLIVMFSKDNTRWNGLRAACRQQMKIYKKKYYSTKAEVV